VTNGPNWNGVWVDVLRKTLDDGRLISTRGENVRERDHVTVSLNMNYPVLTVPERKLNYRFAAAEAEWILRGSNRVEELTPYNARMAEFSDDGETLAGAYGVRFVAQLGYVVEKLRDRNTRQATMTTWVPSPAPSRDIPCTVALDFKIREGRLNAHVFMRSSDIWLGLPYDAFVFTMMSCRILECLNVISGVETILPGTLYITAASSHLYEKHFETAWEVVKGATPIGPKTPLPVRFYDRLSQVDLGRRTLTERLGKLKDTKRGDPSRWWET
jgi:thymidylate synthase